MLSNIPVARAGVTGASVGRPDGVSRRRVEFRAPDGVQLVGHLRVPPGNAGPRPAVVVSNAMTSVKEQSVNAGYAQRLAAAGFVTLAFDQCGFGESGGLPRLHEDNQRRLDDLHIAVSYLTGLPSVVDPERIGVIGVSIGGGLALNLTAYDPRVRAFVAIAAGLLNPARARELMPTYQDMLADQTSLLRRYHRTGALDYIPVVRTPDVPDDQPVLFDNPIATEYYGTPRGAAPNWRNRVSALSLRTILVDDTRTAADTIGPGAGLLIVGDQDVATLPEDHQAVHDRLTGPKRLEILPGVHHNDLYDQAAVGTAADLAADWFTTHLR
ncbi:alpha/beta hydrolase [Actinophytocola gossypii]|uniref:Alpha/beta hydrolase n=1 Tax=Actinophytocola gossypii TaxID=2812003 RepID=A0ABT2J9W1_9PSEU|nr:alpha/beta hydrolase [Actinophytocola gossypii]MCT2584566.1 alpha/beta hydrolase [Actinophytocola gossypii]